MRFLAEVLGDRLADRAARDVVHQDDRHLGAHTVGAGTNRTLLAFGTSALPVEHHAIFVATSAP
jgi:hypothetical protein